MPSSQLGSSLVWQPVPDSWGFTALLQDWIRLKEERWGGEDSYFIYKDETYEFATIYKNGSLVWFKAWLSSAGIGALWAWQAFKMNTFPSQSSSVGSLEHPYHCWGVFHPECLWCFDSPIQLAARSWGRSSWAPPVYLQLRSLWAALCLWRLVLIGMEDSLMLVLSFLHIWLREKLSLLPETQQAQTTQHSTLSELSPPWNGSVIIFFSPGFSDKCSACPLTTWGRSQGHIPSSLDCLVEALCPWLEGRVKQLQPDPGGGVCVRLLAHPKLSSRLSF